MMINYKLRRGMSDVREGGCRSKGLYKVNRVQNGKYILTQTEYLFPVPKLKRKFCLFYLYYTKAFEIQMLYYCTNERDQKDEDQHAQIVRHPKYLANKKYACVWADLRGRTVLQRTRIQFSFRLRVLREVFFIRHKFDSPKIYL